jgi:DNA-binding NarL/FixJ family response regulator
MSICVLVCHDDPIMRAALGALLDNEPDIQVVGAAPGGEEALVTARRLRPDVALISISMLALDKAPCELTRLGNDQSVKVVVLATSQREEHVINALCLGARGVICPGGSPDELLHAIRLVASGNAVVTPLAVGRLLQHLQPDLDEQERVLSGRAGALTPRELEVLQLLARGRSNAEIAGELVLSDATVRSHVHRVLAKLHLHNRTQAVAFAYKTGLVRP